MSFASLWKGWQILCIENANIWVYYYIVRRKDMKLNKIILAIATSVLMGLTLAGCSSAKHEDTDINDTQITAQLPEEAPFEQPETTEKPESPSENLPAEPKEKTVSYITVSTDGVNIRSGAGTNYSVLGTAEKSTLYANLGEENGWVKTQYKNRTAYISTKYCKQVSLKASKSGEVEAVIAEGAKLLGTPYVYGATRLHDGNGRMYSGFTTSEFDCSSLMQYAFYKGAGKLLQVNTRTQIYQGTTVDKSNLQRGDLIFFTNASRKNNKGIERVGHVALYLGDNYILHTASDYAKIEQISSTRWGYYIQTQRII